MVCRNGKCSNYDAENKSFPTLFCSTQTATTDADTHIKVLYVIVLLGHSHVHSWSITQISQHVEETSLLACAPSDY